MAKKKNIFSLYSKDDHVTKPETITETFVISFLSEVLAKIRKDKKIKYLYQLSDEMDFSKRDYSNWLAKFKQNVKILGLDAQIKTIIEARINVLALENEVNTSIAKLNLTNHYGWVDKKETEFSGEVKTAQIFIPDNGRNPTKTD